MHDKLQCVNKIHSRKRKDEKMLSLLFEFQVISVYFNFN